MKKIFAILIILMASTLMFAQSVAEFNFSDASDVTLKLNTSQAGEKKEIIVDEGGIWFISYNRLKNYPSVATIIFDNPFKVSNIGTFRSIDLDYTSFRYESDVTLVFEDYEGQKRYINIGRTSKLDGENTIKWENKNWISNPKERNTPYTPIYPLNKSDLFLIAIQFHLNEGECNVQNIKKISIAYDKANVTGDELVDKLEEKFGINTEEEEKRAARLEAIREEKRLKEEREKALMSD